MGGDGLFFEPFLTVDEGGGTTAYYPYSAVKNYAKKNGQYGLSDQQLLNYAKSNYSDFKQKANIGSIYFGGDKPSNISADGTYIGPSSKSNSSKASGKTVSNRGTKTTSSNLTKTTGNAKSQSTTSSVSLSTTKASSSTSSSISFDVKGLDVSGITAIKTAIDEFIKGYSSKVSNVGTATATIQKAVRGTASEKAISNLSSAINSGVMQSLNKLKTFANQLDTIKSSYAKTDSSNNVSDGLRSVELGRL